MGFRSKLLLSYIILIALITGSFYVYFGYSMQRGMLEDSNVNLTSQTQIARLLVMRDKGATKPHQLAADIGAV
ncbi:MAG TPA: hypothetical protein HPP94_10165 [Desulfuromonadales bacterium]|nr:hypothetical protein [Desulfuromonadales bacterium]